MITRIFEGPTALDDAKDCLSIGSVIAYQDLAPEHVNTVRIALPLLDNATEDAQYIYIAGLYGRYPSTILNDDYLTYGSPLDRPWVTAPQS